MQQQLQGFRFALVNEQNVKRHLISDGNQGSKQKVLQICFFKYVGLHILIFSFVFVFLH